VKLLRTFAAVLSLWIAFAQPAPLATKAEIKDPEAIAVDGSKALYIAADGVIRRVDLKSGIITTVQTTTRLEPINSLTMDAAGNLIATEYTVGRVRRIDPTSGLVTTIAGSKGLEFSGDGGPAIDAGINGPHFVTTDAANNIYLVDFYSNRIRRIDARTGIIATVAGSGKRDSSGDGGPALDAGLEYPNSVAVDPDGNLFIAQYGYGPDSHRIRQVDAKTGIITTVAGLASLQSPFNLLFDRRGNLYVVDHGRVRSIDVRTKRIKTITGSAKEPAGDGGPAIRARLEPTAIAMDSEGNLYIAEFERHRIRRVDARTGVIQTVAGDGRPADAHIVL
jgi:DNA-binding beta-propeller fold protein YncE